MTTGGDDRTRRAYLQLLAGAMLTTGLAGCNALQESRRTPTDTQTTTDQPTSSDNPSTATPDQPPRIVSHSATPEENGKVLAFSIEVKDDNNLDSIVVSYGDQKWARDEIDGTRIDEQGTFTDLTDDNPEDGRVLFVAHDATGQRARADIAPDDTAPTLSTFTVQPTETADELAVQLEAFDDTGLDRVSFNISDRTPTQRSLTGKSNGSIDRKIPVADAADSGVFNTATGRVEDWNGNTQERDTETYVRKYDVFGDPELEIAAVYIPFLGNKWGRCLPKPQLEPAVGYYDSTRDRTAVNRHVDQMQGHGITTLMYNYNGKDSENWQVREFSDRTLTSEIPVEPMYVLSNALKWAEGSVRDRLADDIAFINDHFLSQENTKRYDGRPVVTFWGTNWVAWGGSDQSAAARDAVMSEWGDWEGFVSFLREGFGADDENPYLIAEVRSGLKANPDKFGEFDQHFDALTNWTGKTEADTTVSWSGARSYITDNWEAISAFASTHDQDVIPTVFPGFDDRHNSCWGHNRHVPRSTAHLRELLQIADSYRTRDRINVATFNGWPEGHLIEPGKFKGTNHGTDYLEVISQFQQEANK